MGPLSRSFGRKDEAFEQLVITRIIEPTSKQDAARVLAEAGMPLVVQGFESSKAETKTMIPVIRSFGEAHGIMDVTVVADAGMLSEANLKDVEDTGWTFIVGGKLPEVPYAITSWMADHPGVVPADQMVLSQPLLMGTKTDARRRRVYYQYREDRAWRSLPGIDQQVLKAERAVAEQIPVKRNRFITLSGGSKSVNRNLEAKVRVLAGWKSYVTNLDVASGFVIGAYHQLWQVEHSFRMSKHDLKARLVFHHKRESIDAYLAVVMASLAVSHWIESRTGWTIKQFVQTFRRYRQVRISTGNSQVTAEQPLPDEERTVLARLHQNSTH